MKNGKKQRANNSFITTNCTVLKVPLHTRRINRYIYKYTIMYKLNVPDGASKLFK